MEKLVAVQSDPRYDLIILDTPPTANALDFLDAPERLIEALDSATMRWFIEAFESTGKLSLNLLARSAAVGAPRHREDHRGRLPRGDGRVHHRAERPLRRLQAARAQVEKALRSPEVAFVLVTRPAPMSIQEVLYLLRAARARRACRAARSS